MTISRGWWLGLLGLGLMPLACGDDDDKAEHETEATAGAPAFPESVPPALTTGDCPTAVTGLKLSQPAGADVWGGITLLEFNVAGDKTRNFEVQAFDAATDAWLNNYLGTSYSGQREDGTYLLGVSLYPGAANQDADQQLRVRPYKEGCPDADWVESDTFTLVNPFEGTSWAGTIPASRFNGEWFVNHRDGGEQIEVGDTSLSVTFGDDGSFSETVVLPLSTEKGAPYDGCTMALTFEGSWRFELEANGESPRLEISELTYAGNKGSKCSNPPLADTESAVDVESDENGYGIGSQSYYYPRINYVPTIAIEPGAPVWSADVVNALLSASTVLLSYTVVEEGAGGENGSVDNGYVSGQLNVNEAKLEKQ